MVTKASGKPEHLVAERQALEAMGYWERKKALKEKRRRVYQSQQERKARLKTRRAGRPRGQMQRAFRQYFIRKKVDDEYMNRKARQAGLGWQHKISTIVQRGNVVLPDKEDWEKEYELLRDYLGQFGKLYPEELTGKDQPDIKKFEDWRMTDEELIAALPFTPAPRETEADHSGDVRTTNRRLKDNVYLLVLEEGQGDSKWQFPTVDLKEDESCLEAARRAVAEKVGTELEIWCPSSCPWTVDMARFDDEQQKASGMYGVKNFFMLVNYDDGHVDTEHLGVEDFAWLNRGEIVERMKEQNGETQSKFYHYML